MTFSASCRAADEKASLVGQNPIFSATPRVALQDSLQFRSMISLDHELLRQVLDDRKRLAIVDVSMLSNLADPRVERQGFEQYSSCKN